MEYQSGPPPPGHAPAGARAHARSRKSIREVTQPASPYERTAARQGYANGYKPKRIDTPAGTVTVDVPKTSGHDGEPIRLLPDTLESLDDRFDLPVPSRGGFAEQVDKLVDRPVERMDAGIEDHIPESRGQSRALFTPQARGGENEPGPPFLG